MSRAAIVRFFSLASLLLICAPAARAQVGLPQGLTCGLSYTDDICAAGLLCQPTVSIDNVCNGYHTAGVLSWPSPKLILGQAPGYVNVFDGDLGNKSTNGYRHQELVSGDTYPAPSTNFVLPKGTACGFHHNVFSPGRTCMGYNPAYAFAGVESIAPIPPGCPDGWTPRRALDAGGGYWVWCEYQDPNHLSVQQGLTVSAVGVACGVSHNASGEDPGPTCMGYRPKEGYSSALISLLKCPGLTAGAGWIDQGRSAGVGLGLCTTTSNAMPGPPAPSRGFLDTTVSTNGTFAGWAYDPNAPETSIYVDLYVDGPAGSGAPGFRVVANGSRPDVNSYFNIPGNHGYSFTLPSQYLGGTHTVYAYGISLFGQANPLLAQSPGTYSPPAPPPPPPPLCKGCLTP